MDAAQDENSPTVSRWMLIRDVGVFQVKLIVDGLRDLLLVPAALVAGIVSLLSTKDGQPGPQFYHLLQWGKQSERWIDLFNSVKNAPEQTPVPPQFAEQGMDDIVERFEAFVVAEYKSGGLTAQAKEQLNRLLKTVQRRTRDE
tara:strand:+ start:26094 stop:26522 length:429 start_codon:yes stop_codon:yes gene_type:complete